MVERRWADRPEWAAIAERRFTLIPVAAPEFSGLVTLTEIGRIDAPQTLDLGGHAVTLADTGYALLMHFPNGAKHVITTVFDADGYVAIWLVAVCREHGLDDRVVPWYDDLLLNVAVLPDGMVVLRGEEELEAALAAGTIAPEDWRLARQEARQIIAALEEGLLPGMALSVQHLHTLREIAIQSTERGPR